MIIFEKPKLAYGRFFLAFEAPGDETPKRRVKVVDVKPNNRRRTDFTSGAEEVDDADEPADDTADTAAEDPTEGTPEEAPEDNNAEEVDDDYDFTTDDAGEDDLSLDDDPEGTDAEADGPDIEGDEDFTMDDDTGAEGEPTDSDAGTGEEADGATDDGGEDIGDGPDTGGDEDFTMDGEDDEAGDNEGGDDTATATDTTDDGTKSGAGVEYDSTRKYVLFKEFMKLASSLDIYISKMENTITSNGSINSAYKIATEKLRDIRQLLNDYMMMRFTINSYVQSLLFFDSQVAAVQLIFSIVRKAQTEFSKKK